MSESVQRILLTPERIQFGLKTYLHGCVYAVKSRSPDDPLKAILKEPIFDDIAHAHSELTRTAIPIERGPYADYGGNVSGFARIILDGVARSDLPAILGRIGDCRPFTSVENEGAFPRVSRFPKLIKIDPTRSTSLLLSNAGLLLDQETLFGSVSERGVHVLGSEFDFMLIAIAVLRNQGYAAYPAFSDYLDRNGDQAREPVMAILNPEGAFPLMVAKFVHYPPEPYALDILSDIAVLGITHSLKAKALVNHLAFEFNAGMVDGSAISQDRLEYYLRAIAFELAEGTRAWQSTFVTDDVLSFMRSTFEDVGHSSAKATIVSGLTELMAAMNVAYGDFEESELAHRARVGFAAGAGSSVLHPMVDADSRIRLMREGSTQLAIDLVTRVQTYMALELEN